MNKKILILAFVSVAFFLGCSADGIFDTGNPGSAQWSKDKTSGGSGYCLIAGQCLQLSAANCANASGYYFPTLADCNNF
ncbi:MAG: hypothetical protein FWC15_00630 [Fibromonadales bacterium]|nr:hypothetical protein [Fibromonadales bacterium]